MSDNPNATVVSFTFECDGNLWQQEIHLDGDMAAHSALKLLAECANRTLLQIGKDMGVFSR